MVFEVLNYYSILENPDTLLKSIEQPVVFQPRKCFQKPNKANIGIMAQGCNLIYVRVHTESGYFQ
jgi:hypothetical protein